LEDKISSNGIFIIGTVRAIVLLVLGPGDRNENLYAVLLSHFFPAQTHVYIHVSICQGIGMPGCAPWRWTAKNNNSIKERTFQQLRGTFILIVEE
jgi:hypothetical protein